MKLTNLLILLLIVNSVYNLKDKTFLSITSKAGASFMKIMAKVTGGGSIKKSVRIYNRALIGGKEEGHRIFRAQNDLIVHPSGEVKILQTPKGPRKCHKLLESDRLNLQDPKTDGGRDTGEMWIPSEHLINIKYPAKGINLTRNGDSIANT